MEMGCGGEFLVLLNLSIGTEPGDRKVLQARGCSEIKNVCFAFSICYTCVERHVNEMNATNCPYLTQVFDLWA